MESCETVKEYIYETFFTKRIIPNINLHLFQQAFKTQIDFQNYIMKLKLKTLIFVDIDNHVGYFTKLNFDTYSNIHFGIFLSHEKISENSQNKLNKSYISIMKPTTKEKNSVDILLCAEATALNMLLPNNIRFIIISRDKFIGELKETLKIFNPDRQIECDLPEKLIDLLDSDNI